MDSFNPEIHTRPSGGVVATDLNASGFKLQLVFLWTNTWKKTFEFIFVFTGVFRELILLHQGLGRPFSL